MARKSIFAEQQNSKPTANELFESFLDDDLKNNMLDLCFTVANKNDLETVLSELHDDTRDFYLKNLR